MGIQSSWRETLRNRFLHLISPLDLREGHSGSDEVDVLLNVLGNVILAASDVVFLRWHVMKDVVLRCKQRFQLINRGLKLEPSPACRDLVSLIINT